MIYEEFKEIVEKHINVGGKLYQQAIKKMIDEPSMFCSDFRLTSFRTKIIQHLTQSNEIKLGDILEEVFTDYLGKNGYTNLEKNITHIVKGKEKKLSFDQRFEYNNEIYLIEQKIRDNHDSTKKTGQFDNFELKLEVLHELHPTKKINGYMWFIDENVVKNKNYYETRFNNLNFTYLKDKGLYYGDKMLKKLKLDDAYSEIISNLAELREIGNDDIINFPDIDKSAPLLTNVVANV